MAPSREDLLSYIDTVKSQRDLLSPPPVPPPVAEEPWWTWQDVACDDVDRGLERWAWGLTSWGREVAVTAALGVLEHVTPIWDRAAAAGAPGTRDQLMAARLRGR
jgi:hypothetical protein